MPIDDSASWAGMFETWTTILANVVTILGVPIAIRLAAHWVFLFRVEISASRIQRERSEHVPEVRVWLPSQAVLFMDEPTPDRPNIWQIYWVENGRERRAFAYVKSWMFHFRRIWLGTKFQWRTGACQMRYLEKCLADKPATSNVVIEKLLHLDHDGLSKSLSYILSWRLADVETVELPAAEKGGSK